MAEIMNIEIKFNDAESEVFELKEYIQNNLIIQVEADYDALAEMLEDVQGNFKMELLNSMRKEQEAVHQFIQRIKEVYELLDCAAKEFEQIDRQYSQGAN